LAGTYPTFIVDERWVVKFYGRLFDGGTCFSVERLCARLVQACQPLPTADVLGWGELLPDRSWHWPYIIFKYIPGISLGEAWSGLIQVERRKLAGWLGEAVRKLHQIPLDDDALNLPSKILSG
jgi:hypothetical protein